MLDGIRRDILIGLRQLARARGVAAAAIATIAIGVGANTALFSMVNALLLAPVPVAAPERLARIRTGESLTSWPNFADLGDRGSRIADVAAHRHLTASLTIGDQSTRLRGEIVSTNYLSILGVPAAVGRTFSQDEADAGVVVLGDRAYRRTFGGDPSVIGRVVTLNGRRVQIIGVMPPDFRALAPPGLDLDFWCPIEPRASGTMADRAARVYELAARLRDDATHEQAMAAFRGIAAQMRAEHPDLPDSFAQVMVEPVDGVYAFTGMATLMLPVFAFLALLLILTAFVLLIGCANIVGLLLSRAATRHQEIAVRLALGASRLRLLRQLVTESLTLALLGGAAGVLLSHWLVQVVSMASAGLPVPIELDVRIDGRVLAYALAVSTMAALLFGLAPAWRATRLDLVSAFKNDGGSASAAGSSTRFRRVLVAAQVAISTALLLWSGLFARSLFQMDSVDPGFEADGVQLATVFLDRGAVSEAAGAEIMRQWMDRVAAAPGVESAAIATVVPLALTGREDFPVSLPRDDAGTRRWVVANRSTPGWFGTLRIPIVAGRDFAASDREGSPDVAIVNETLAREFWQGSALGQRLRFGKRQLEVVGVARDSKYRTIGETIAPTVYLPFRQHFLHEATLHVRPSDPAGTRRVMVESMRAIAPDVSVDVQSMPEAVAIAVLPARVGAAATGAFGFVAVLLCAIGLYGLVSYAVIQRSREIGIRRAIGAGTMDILSLIARSHARVVVVGLAVGLCAGVLGAMGLRSFLTGTGPLDPGVLLGAIVVVLLMAAVATLVPARRLAALEPLAKLTNRA